MAQNKLLSVILVLILLVFFQEIQCIVGRHLILDPKSNFEKLQSYDSARILAKETGTFLDGKVNLHGVNVKAVDSSAQSPPSPPSVVVGDAPPPKNADDFRPTAPGHSPGVGHSLQN